MPHNYQGDATDHVIRQIERFAPGFRDTIAATSTRNAPEMAAYNPNYVGGDIGTGANTAKQIALRPRFALNPYKLGLKGVYFCSSATPPGAYTGCAGSTQPRRQSGTCGAEDGHW